MSRLEVIRRTVGRRWGRRSLLSREALHGYWRAPSDGTNRPDDYATRGESRSRLLLEPLTPHLTPDAQILELGCNVGRNLSHLWDAGYRNLSAVESSPDAVAEMARRFPTMAEAADVTVAPIEDVISAYPDQSFDAVFTVAVLEHLHPESEWVFGEMARITRRALVTIEDEVRAGERHVPRDYGEVFTGLGLAEVRAEPASAGTDLPAGFIARVFERQG